MSDQSNTSLVEQLYDYPYNRLNKLLGHIKPDQDVLLTHIGEPQGNPPKLLADTVAKNSHLWSKYPPIKGTVGFRQAATDWAIKRYNLPESFLDPESNVIPVNGTREALFQAGLYAADRKRAQLSNNEQPIICLPNPLYHVYFGAALMGHAEAVMVDAIEDNHFIPDFESLPEETLRRTALVYLCTPGNPVGTVASLDRLKAMLEAARKYDFILAVDECYSEIWTDEPPAGGLDAAKALGDSLDNLLVFNSLSKRSSAPGLRCGMVIGEAKLLQDLNMLRGYGGAQVPGPLLAAATELWKDDAHVAENRDLYRRLISIADEELGNLSGYRSPDAAFFVWFNTAKHGLSGEEAATKLWQDEGIKVMPGRYMCRADDKSGKSPGDDYVRLALVHDEKTVKEICTRVRRSLT
ncbi:aminotransferase class I/II-fold pyridoxal phosphate-dependent enzyme [Curvivirga aplysinae]|uniref:aminotransferase class I/II-fold pyridoxal phosphate-dependent enzyme n=1 Tax=Curvivirga aplysinae TaxID=2529852 RepID=UPI0012BD3BBB|nr:aminotransferase class I/II-fold pyridoxal phosphate-dependent enzyme [Curvivirga aplysinae]MTI09890.1 aminotransferase class I/II-fold pyridoxal phosphate-dependent enzyme [Curvivirga aplysinae]